MLDLKALKSALLQMEEERKIPKDKIIEAIEQSLAAAYKKDYGKKGQIIRANLDLDSGAMDFTQVKIVVDESTVRFPVEGEEFVEEETDEEGEDVLPVYNPEKHILIEDAKKIKKDAELGEEIVFPLEMKDDFGRIAAQTAKQVIIQRIREAEKSAVMEEYGDREGDIVSGMVQKVERGTVFVDFQKATGILPRQEQIPGERFLPGQRIKAYLMSVEESPRGVSLYLSRSHPNFIEALFAVESPEIANGIVEIKNVSREAGSRSKIAVWSNDETIDPIGACVGQRGVRVSTVMNELGGEKIDIIKWSEDPIELVAASLSPAKVLSIEINEEEKTAKIEVADDQLSLAIGKGGQNVRLAAKLTGWKIDIKGAEGVVSEEGEIISDESENLEETEANTEEELSNEGTPSEESVSEETEESKSDIEENEEQA